MLQSYEEISIIFNFYFHNIALAWLNLCYKRCYARISMAGFISFRAAINFSGSFGDTSRGM